MKIVQCNICYEAWPLSVSAKGLKDCQYYVCARCKSDKETPGKFSKENKMVPSKVPDSLKDLIQVEEMLISRAFPVMQIHTKPSGGQQGCKDHVINLPNDDQKLADILPRYPKDIPVIVFKFNGKDSKSQELKVRRNNVENALTWLTGTNENGEPNNFLYENVTIYCDLLESLPVDGYLSETKSDREQLEFVSECNYPT